MIFRSFITANVRFASSVLACFAAATTAAFASFSPVLNLVEPRGGTLGTELEIHLHGDRLDALEEIIWYEPGISLLELNTSDPKHAIARIQIAPEATLGEHSLRLRSDGGISELRSFFVGPWPVIMETEPNSAGPEAQAVPLGTTIQGTAGNEDVDAYAVDLVVGQRLAVEVEAMRLGRTFFDAHIAILDPSGREIAACDDRPLLRTDAQASIIAAEAGRYQVLVREAAYEGNDQCGYRLHIGDFPRPTAVLPSSAMPGETLDLTFLGDPTGPITHRVAIQTEAAGLFPVFAIQNGVSAPSPNWIWVSPLAHSHPATFPDSVESAHPFPPLPAAVDGILSGNFAWFSFTATKDTNYDFRVRARDLRSPLDSVLVLLDSAGASIAENDDSGTPDSLIQWTCPADGTYFLRITDQLGRTGGDFQFRIEAGARQPAIAASLPTVERVQTQKWKTFSVPVGNRYAAVINVTRTNFAGELVLEPSDLPSGIVMHAVPIHPSVSSIPVVFEANPGSVPSSTLATFSVRASGEGATLEGPLLDTIAHVDINNEGAYHHAVLPRIASAVVAAAPLTISLTQPTIPIARNGSLPLEIKIARAPGFAATTVLRFLWNPPGISAPVTLEMPPDQDLLTYEIQANGDAAIGDWPMVVLAEAVTDQGPVLVSSELRTVTIIEPMLELQLDIAAAEQGMDTAWIANVQPVTPFPGSATAELVGLPHGVAAQPVAFSAESTEVRFELKIAADAAIGKHSSIFCRVQVPAPASPEEIILHQTARGSTLRIDAPPPPAVDAPAAEPTPEPAAPAATERPLSRLEQLRQRKQAQD